MREEWKWIKGYEGLYQISNHGRLKSFLGNKDGNIRSVKNSKGWYLTTQIFDKNKIRKTVRIHRLVAETFIGDIPEGYEIHHKDGNRQNNFVGNLEIIESKQHRILTLIEHPECVEALNNANKYGLRKPIRQYTLDGHYVAEYANSCIAEKYTGVCQRNILQVAVKEPFNSKGSVRKQAGGYVWKFADESEVV